LIPCGITILWFWFNVDWITKPIALIVTASFCDEERRAKDIVESRFPAPKK